MSLDKFIAIKGVHIGISPLHGAPSHRGYHLRKKDVHLLLESVICVKSATPYDQASSWPSPLTWYSPPMWYYPWSGWEAPLCCARLLFSRSFVGLFGVVGLLGAVGLLCVVSVVGWSTVIKQIQCRESTPGRIEEPEKLCFF